jgi:hypothetical protein
MTCLSIEGITIQGPMVDAENKSYNEIINLMEYSVERAGKIWETHKARRI